MLRPVALPLLCLLCLIGGPGPVLAVPLSPQDGDGVGMSDRGDPLSASLRADVGPKGAASVTLTYRLRIPSGVDTVPVQTVNFLGAEVEGLAARVEGEPATLRRRTTDPRLVRAVVDVPVPHEAGDTVRVELSYQVAKALRTDGENFDVVIPVVLVDWQPSSAPPDMFDASLLLPPEFSATKVFPTVPRETVDEGGARKLSLSLQVAPSMLRVGGVVGESVFLTRGRIVDLAVAALLAGLLALGVYRWRLTLEDDRDGAEAAGRGGGRG